MSESHRPELQRAISETKVAAGLKGEISLSAETFNLLRDAAFEAYCMSEFPLMFSGSGEETVLSFSRMNTVRFKLPMSLTDEEAQLARATFCFMLDRCVATQKVVDSRKARLDDDGKADRPEASA